MADLSQPKPAEERERILTDGEVKALCQASEGLGYPWGPFYQLLLLSAQRREEVAGLEWAELDLEKALWTIPAERIKTGNEHLVHLSPQTLAVLATIPHQASPFVFTTTLKTPVSGYSRAKEQLDALMKPGKPWRIHDLRRTAATGMASLGFPPHVVDKGAQPRSAEQGEADLPALRIARRAQTGAPCVGCASGEVDRLT
jgi:integrase